MKRAIAIASFWALCMFPAQAQLNNVEIDGPDLVCLGDCATYVGTGPGATFWFTWILSNGQVVGNGPSVTICWDNPGEFILIAQADNAQLSDTMVVTVLPGFPPPILTLSGADCPVLDSLSGPGACQQVCAYSTVVYSTTQGSSNPPGGGQWTVSGAESVVFQGDQVIVTWGGPGQGEVNLFASDPSGGYCPGENSLCVDILEEPEATFSTLPAANSDTLTICRGQTVYFDNTSQGAIFMDWDFGTLGATSQPSPEWTFNQAGVFQVALTASNACLCSDTDTLFVEVLDTEIPLVNCTGAVCPGSVVEYTATAGCGTFLWSVSNGGTILGGGGLNDDFVTVQWNDGPLGQIALAVEDCSGNYCTGSIFETIPVLADGIPIEGPVLVCQGDVVAYEIPELQGSDYLWTLSSKGVILSGQNTNRILVRWEGALSAGSPEMVQVAYNNCFLECGGQSQLDVFLQNEFYIQGPIEACPGDQDTYFGQSVQSGSSNLFIWTLTDAAGNTLSASGPDNTADIAWNFGPGIFQITATPNTPGEYCQENYAIFVRVLDLPSLPDSIVGATLVCPGQPYSYQAFSANPSNLFTWQITNDASQTSLSGNPIVVNWGPTPPYQLSVAQTLTSGLACASGAIDLNIQAFSDLQLTGPSITCAGEEVVLQTLPEVIWTIDPPGAAVPVDPLNGVFYLPDPGIITVEASYCGLSSQLVLQAESVPAPVVNAPASLCLGSTGAVSTAQAYASYSWQDESGLEISTLATPDLPAGAYVLEVTDANGCSGTTSFVIAEAPAPEVTLSSPDNLNICPPADPFPVLYATETGVGYSYQWFFDGAPQPGSGSVFATTAFGTYQVEVSTPDGCTLLSNTVQVSQFCSGGGGGGFPIPGLPGSVCLPGTLAQFVIQPFADCNTAQFANTSPDLQPATVSWDFGDGTLVNDPAPVVAHTYAEAGYYLVVISGLSSAGDFCYYATPVEIAAAAAFWAPPGCPGAPLLFEDRSTYLPGNAVVGWSWDFGDPASGLDNVSNLQNPQHVYTTPGLYTVTLTITEAGGCTSTVAQNVEVRALPAVDFAVAPLGCVQTSAPFEALVGPEVVSVAWDFGDGVGTSSDFNPYYAYASPGTYTATLTGTDIFGCANTAAYALDVQVNSLSGNISSTVDPPVLCEGDDLTLSPPPGGVSWSWSNGAPTEDLLVVEAGVYGVTLTDAGGCAYAPQPVEVSVIPEPNASVSAVEYNEYGQPVAVFYNTYSACEGEDVYLEVPQNAQYGYQWSVGGSTTQIIFAEWRGNALAVGQHTFSVTVTDFLTGCQSLETFTVEVHPLPDPVVLTASPFPACAGDPVVLAVQNPDPDLVYIWNTGETGTSIQTTTGGEYYVRAFNAFGCERESNRLIIQPGPPIGQVPSGCHTRCSPDTLCLPDLPTVVSYVWYLDGNPIGAQADLPIDQSGVYWVEMTDIFGCTAISDPLELELVPGFGTLNGEVYVDVNENGIWDGPDTLIGQIPLLLLENGTLSETATTNAAGSFVFDNIPAGDYTVQVDTAGLPPALGYLIWSAAVQVVGCNDQDSTVFLLTPECPAVFETIELSACPGEPVVFNGQTLFPGESAQFNFNTIIGCDSILTVSVEALPVQQTGFVVAICPDETYPYNGLELAPGETQSFVFVNQFGCDSVVTVQVDSLAEAFTTVNLTACEGGSATYNGVEIAAGTSQDFPFSTYQGCDSTVTVVVESLPVSANQVNITVCAGETVTYAGTVLQAGDQQIFTLTNQWGCDSVVTVTVGAYPIASLEVAATDACPGKDNGSLVVEQLSGLPPFLFSLDGLVWTDENIFDRLPAGAYTVWMEDGNGCRVEADVVVNNLAALSVLVQTEAVSCETGQAQVFASLLTGDPSITTLTWPDGTEGPVWTTSTPGDFALIAQDSCGTIQVDFRVGAETDERLSFFYVPNVFSPNFDGVNDEFLVFPGPGVEISLFNLLVFDRWGGLLFQTDDIQIGWDGRTGLEELDPGVYVYYFEAEIRVCGQSRRIFKEGDITLIR